MLLVVINQVSFLSEPLPRLWLSLLYLPVLWADLYLAGQPEYSWERVMRSFMTSHSLKIELRSCPVKNLFWPLTDIWLLGHLWALVSKTGDFKDINRMWRQAVSYIYLVGSLNISVSAFSPVMVLVNPTESSPRLALGRRISNLHTSTGGIQRTSDIYRNAWNSIMLELKGP